MEDPTTGENTNIDREERAWREMQYLAFSSSDDFDQSAFAGDQAVLLKSIGAFRLFRLGHNTAPLFSTLLKLNLLLSVICVFFFAYQIASSGKSLHDSYLLRDHLGRLLPKIILWTLGLAAVAGLLWLIQRPKRIKPLSHSLVLWVGLSENIFCELAIPWQSVENIKVVEKKLAALHEKETRLEITTALGLRHVISLDEMLADNSEASFITAVRTLAPWAATELTFDRGTKQEENAAGLTELWLHQFNVSKGRKENDLLPAGRILPGYTIIGILGGGGQGNTYMARAENDPAAQNVLVLKEYIMPVYRGTSVLARLGEKLEQEALMLAGLEHQSIVKVLGHFLHDYRGYLVLEFVEGRSLKQLVMDEGAQPQQFVLSIAEKLLDVLVYLHSSQPPIVHRDLSPDNIMLSADGEIKVVDFNVARQLEGGSGSTVVGKHAYMPPEQFRGKPCPASDIYALGATMHFLLTGREAEPLAVSHPRLINETVSPALDLIVARATAQDLEKRYGAAWEMQVDLSREVEKCSSS